MTLAHKLAQLYVKVRKKNLLRDPSTTINDKIFLNSELSGVIERYYGKNLFQGVLEYFRRYPGTDYQMVDKGILKSYLKVSIRDSVLVEYDLREQNIAHYTNILNELGVRFDRVSRTFQLNGRKLNAPLLHGIAKTYLKADEELRRVYRSSLEEALEAGDFRIGEKIEETLFDRLRKIVAKIQDYDGITQGTIKDGRQVWLPLDVAKFYAQGSLQLSK